MTMNTFKSLLTAAGADLSNGHDQGLDLQCKATGAVKHVIMIQRVLGDIRLSAHVITDNGVCKLTEITVPRCQDQTVPLPSEYDTRTNVHRLNRQSGQL